MNCIWLMEVRRQFRGKCWYVPLLDGITREHVWCSDHDDLPLVIDVKQDGRLQPSDELYSFGGI